MRQGKQIGADVRSAQVSVDDVPAATTPPPFSARPKQLEMLRAGLLSLLAREPRVCRCVGLVR